MKEPYYTTYQKREWTELQAMKGAIQTLQKKRNVFLDCGLKEAADRVWTDIADVQQKHDTLAEKMIRDRERMAAELVKVMLIAYLAYSKALDFEDTVRKLTGVQEDALSEDMSRMVKVCEELALAIDKGCGDERQAYAFGELTDKLEDKFKELVEPEIDKLISDFRSSKVFKLF